jgi:hypothetical protein
MAELSYIQELESDRTFKPSAHLMETSFQLFASSQITIPRVMLSLLAQPNLENQIRQDFQKPAIAIT